LFKFLFFPPLSIDWQDAIESTSISTEVGVPEPPHGLEISLRTHNSIFIKWERPHDNGLPVEGFQVVVHEMNTNESKEGKTVTKKCFKMFVDIDATGMPPTSSGIENKLITACTYTVHIEATNECGWSPPSPHIQFSTRSIEAPEPPWTIPEVMGKNMFSPSFLFSFFYVLFKMLLRVSLLV
jgi:hypothetical protein